jgi:hypothetical protein
MIEKIRIHNLPYQPSGCITLRENNGIDPDGIKDCSVVTIPGLGMDTRNSDPASSVAPRGCSPPYSRSTPRLPRQVCAYNSSQAAEITGIHNNSAVDPVRNLIDDVLINVDRHDLTQGGKAYCQLTPRTDPTRLHHMRFLDLFIRSLPFLPQI